MYEASSTFIQDTLSRKIAAGERFTESGIVATYTRENGELEVRLSRGGANEEMAGITLTRSVPPAILHKVVEAVIPSALKVDLGRTPIIDQHLVKIDDVKAEMVADLDTLAAGKYFLDGDVVTFHTEDEGKELFVQMAYEPTVSEAREVLGDSPIGGLSETVTDMVTLITKGQVGTNMFDASSDWTATDELHPRLGANGTFTLEGSGRVLTNVIIVTAPSSESSCLVVELR